MKDDEHKEPGNIPLSIFIVLALLLSIFIFVYAFYAQAKPRDVGPDVENYLYLDEDLEDAGPSGNTVEDFVVK